MAAAASQLCVRQARTVSSTTKAVKLNRFHLFFNYISTSFSSSEEQRSVLCQPDMPSTVQMISIHREYGSRFMAKEEKSTFQISSLLLSSFISNIYIHQRKATTGKICQTV